jgi:AcrR family transcriptional regulator
MPYPSQVSPEAIIAKARELVEQEGYDQLSLARLADALGIKSPSLYRYFNSKNMLLRAVNDATGALLITSVNQAIAAASDAPDTQIMAMARAYRAFAHANPANYALLYSALSPDAQSDPQQAEKQVLPLQSLLAQVSGEANSLTALRGALALIHGFIMLELTGNFRRGGDLDAAYEQSVRAYIIGCAGR